jgi:transcription elongation factor GreA
MSDSHDAFLTAEKFEELKKELEYLKTTRRKEVAESLEYARSLGDLSENAEYQEARDMQAAIEERIQHLERVIKEAKIVVGDKKAAVVGLGSVVTMVRDGEKEQRIYTIVGSEEANIHEHKLSYLSPLGEALMGKQKGESFTFVTPNGKQAYKVLETKIRKALLEDQNSSSRAFLFPKLTVG